MRYEKGLKTKLFYEWLKNYRQRDKDYSKMATACHRLWTYLNRDA